MIANIDPTGGVSLAEIETATRQYAEARDVLAGYVGTLNDEIEALKRKAMADIKRALNRAREREEKLRDLIAHAPELFIRPRTVVFHGVKVGFQKGKGTLEIPDADDTLARIKRLFGENAELYIRTKETPNKDALAELPAADLKKLGCILADTGDEVVIKATDTDVDKIVSALLKEPKEEVRN